MHKRTPPHAQTQTCLLIEAQMRCQNVGASRQDLFYLMCCAPRWQSIYLQSIISRLLKKPAQCHFKKKSKERNERHLVWKGWKYYNFAKISFAVFWIEADVSCLGVWNKVWCWNSRKESYAKCVFLNVLFSMTKKNLLCYVPLNSPLLFCNPRLIDSSIDHYIGLVDSN